MTKSEFAKTLAERNDLSQGQAEKITNDVLDIITEALKAGDKIAFTGFGNFSISKRAAREGVNPRVPGEKIQIPARNAVKFSPGAGLKSAVN
jgi:DNA-binding protein HU-beta